MVLKGFVSESYYQDMFEGKVTHIIYFKNYLMKNGINKRGQYNQVANYVCTQAEINNAISDKSQRIILQRR